MLPWFKKATKGSSQGSQLCTATGFCLAPLLDTNVVYFRGIDFSEGPAATFLNPVSLGGDTGLQIAVPSLPKAWQYAIFHIFLLLPVFFNCYLSQDASFLPVFANPSICSLPVSQHIQSQKKAITLQASEHEHCRKQEETGEVRDAHLYTQIVCLSLLWSLQ